MLGWVVYATSIAPYSLKDVEDSQGVGLCGAYTVKRKPYDQKTNPSPKETGFSFLNKNFMTIIIDFNRTIYDPEVGELLPGALDLLQTLQGAGHELYLVSRIEVG